MFIDPSNLAVCTVIRNPPVRRESVALVYWNSEIIEAVTDISNSGHAPCVRKILGFFINLRYKAIPWRPRWSSTFTSRLYHLSFEAVSSLNLKTVNELLSRFVFGVLGDEFALDSQCKD